jgi:L-rhamnose mutarotase
MKTKRYCLTLDLKNDADLISEYKKHHERIWPEIYESIKKSGIVDMEIYLFGNRLFMILEAIEDFSFAKKEKMEANNPKVAEWENLMWKYQQPLSDSRQGEKWKLMERIFCLTEQINA